MFVTMLPPEYGLKFEFSQLIYEALQIFQPRYLKFMPNNTKQFDSTGRANSLLKIQNTSPGLGNRAFSVAFKNFGTFFLCLPDLPMSRVLNIGLN